MKIKEARMQIEAASKMFDTLGEVRRKLVGQELTYELFAELNGAERGLEQLVNHDIEISFSDVGAVASLKSEIFEALTAQEIEAGQTIHAALECYCQSLMDMMADYDAYAEENIELRQKLEEKLKGLTKDQKTQLAGTKIEYESFGYTNALEIINLMNEMVKFFSSETFNLKMLSSLQSKQGIDLTEEEKTFLDTLTKVGEQDVRRPGWQKLDVIWGDRLANAKLETLGFDSKNLIEVSKALTKAENAFYKTAREIKEALCGETATTDEIAVKNTKFYRAVDMLLYYTKDLSGAAKALGQQLALICKAVDFQEVQKPDNTQVDNNGDQHDVDNPPTPDNSGEGDANNPPTLD